MSRVATATATVPQPCRVLGTVLRPFCLGHHLLFKRLGLPFAGSHEADAGQDDILIGIAVCGANSDDTLESFLDGSWPDVFARWKRSVAGRWFWPNKVNMLKAEKLFRGYLKRGYEMPPIWKYKENGVALSAPWEQLLKVRLVQAGFTERDVLNGFLPARWYDYFTVNELEQAANIADKKKFKPVFYTPHDDEMLKNKGGVA
jgi:hypothetical protein